jgi:hypothetical protein
LTVTIAFLAEPFRLLDFIVSNLRRPMKPLALAGTVFIVLGLAALVYQGFSYTSRDTVLDIGPCTPPPSASTRSRFRQCWGSRRWPVAWQC